MIAVRFRISASRLARLARSSAWLPGLVLFCLVAPCEARDATANRWGVFETEFRAARSYANPPFDARMQVEFTSPAGVTRRTHAFWDGTNRWKVRFSPDTIGAWTFRTEASDPRDAGLHGREGSFACTVPLQTSPLTRSGPLRVAPGGAYFEHADGTPFFWLADTALPSVTRGSLNHLREYLTTRAAQGFTVTMWRAWTPPGESGLQMLGRGTPPRLNVSALRRMDAGLELARDAQLASAIVPYSEMGLAEEDLLPEGEVIALLRQLVARWDAYPVTWIMELDADARRMARGRRILRQVFEGMNHAPVLVFCGEAHWALEPLREDAWVNALGFQAMDALSPEGTLWLTSGPLSSAWLREPAKPLVNLRPSVEAGLTPSGVVGSAGVLRELCRSLFMGVPAGVAYRARGVTDWDTTRDTNTLATVGVVLEEWQKGLHLPTAKQLGAIRTLFEEARFSMLHPQPDLLVTQPGLDDPLNHISVLADTSRTYVMLFVPAGQTARLQRARLPSSLAITRLALQTGERVEVSAESGPDTLVLTAGDSSDCLFKLTTR